MIAATRRIPRASTTALTWLEAGYDPAAVAALWIKLQTMFEAAAIEWRQHRQCRARVRRLKIERGQR